jgi:hypothetical protein
MSSVIKLTPNEWFTISKQIQAEYKPSIFLIRDAMRRELGFTVRRHTEWVQHPNSGQGRSRPIETVCLDFYTEPALTWFQLKYL